MNSSKKLYLLLVAIIIVLGIISRKIVCVPLCIGDILYGSLIFFIVRFLFISNKMHFSITVAVIVCFIIEFSQLYQGEWIVRLRNTLLGHYALGVGFLWMDLLWYTIGIYLAYLTEKIIHQSLKTKNK